EALILAVVKLYGAPALPGLLAAFDDSRLPPDARGLPLWQAVFQLADMDLPAVVDEFYRAIAAYAEEHEERIAALPRPRAVLVRSGRTYGILTLVDDAVGRLPPSEGEAAQSAAPGLVLRVRPAPGSPLETFTAADTYANGIYWLSPDRIASGRACVQPGVKIGGE